MTMHVPDVDPLAKPLLAELREMMREAVCRQAAAERKAAADKVDVEINAATIAVARASDRLVEARFSGAPEGDAHRKLIKATAALSAVMRKHGRMPKGSR